MDNWDATAVRLVVDERHRDDIARGLAAQHLATALGTHPHRARFAAALVALAQWLSPAPSPAPADHAAVPRGPTS